MEHWDWDRCARRDALSWGGAPRSGGGKSTGTPWCGTQGHPVLWGDTVRTTPALGTPWGSPDPVESPRGCPPHAVSPVFPPRVDSSPLPPAVQSPLTEGSPGTPPVSSPPGNARKTDEGRKKKKNPKETRRKIPNFQKIPQNSQFCSLAAKPAPGRGGRHWGPTRTSRGPVGRGYL